MPLSSLRILHIQPFTFDIFGHRDEDWGTKSRYFLPNLVAAQVKQNDQPSVHLLTSSSRTWSMNVEGVDVHFHRCLQLPRFLPVTNRFGRQISMSILKAIQSETADIVHFHGACSLHLMYGAVALRARQQQLPLASQDHGPREGRWLERKFWKIGLRNTQAVLAGNAESMKTLERAGVPWQIMSIMPNGFDPEVFYPAKFRIRDPHAPLRVLVVSRLWHDKDPFTMADGVSAFVRRGGKLELTVIGQGVLRKKVEQRLHAASIQARFIENISQVEMRAHYQAADAVVLTSLREGWNQATIEAMACGLPVIATDIPGIRDGVDTAGILIPVKRPDLLADALEWIDRHPESALDYRRRGLQRAQEFTWDRLATKLRSVYLKCLESPSGLSSAEQHAFPSSVDLR